MNFDSIMEEHLAISIIWSLIVHKNRPDRYEITGSKIAVSGTAVIFYVPS
jgi:drug/metabolite transporter superfamily protein YnfA